MKIAIIGYSGSGKSTLARHISKIMNIPVLHFDKVNWSFGWNEREHSEQLNIVREFLNKNSSWVIDGNYSKLFYEERMSGADKIIFMNFGRFNCLFRAIKRFRKYKGSTRADMGEGCPEKLDVKFIKWILIDGRNKSNKQRYSNIIKKYDSKVIIIKNQKQLNELYKLIEHGGEYEKSL